VARFSQGGEERLRGEGWGLALKVLIELLGTVRKWITDGIESKVPPLDARGAAGENFLNELARPWFEGGEERLILHGGPACFLSE
jgi:hypothetical protein